MLYTHSIYIRFFDSRVRPYVRESRRLQQRHLPSAGAAQPEQPQPPVSLHVPSGARPARAGRVPHLRPARETTRVSDSMFSFLLSLSLFLYIFLYFSLCE